MRITALAGGSVARASFADFVTTFSEPAILLRANRRLRGHRDNRDREHRGRHLDPRLQVCPDLDTVMYTLGEGIDPVAGAASTKPSAPRRNSPRTGSSPHGSGSVTEISGRIW